MSMTVNRMYVLTLTAAITKEFGDWMLGEGSPQGIADAIHDIAGDEYHDLDDAERLAVVQAVVEEIYGQGYEMGYISV